MNRDSSSVHRVQPLRQRLRAETARAIAAAAEEVFAERGLKEARVEEIAARAGVSVGTLYNHFADRRALLAGLVERRRKELADKLDAALAASGAFEAHLRDFVRTVFEHFDAHREFLAILLEADTARLAQPSEAMRELRRHADELVARGVRGRALRKEGADLWGALLLGTVRALLVDELRRPGRLTVEERAARAVEYFLRGACAR